MGSASAEAASADGRWAGAVYTKWTSTTYTLLLLRSMGLAARHPQALQACEVLRDSGFWTDGGINFYAHRTNRSETRISSMVLALVCWFQLEDTQVDRLAGTCLAGSWRMAVELPFQGGGRASHGSFHTTIWALEALLEYERFRPDRAPAAREAQARGREFLLVRRLFRSHRTGAVVKAAMTRQAFPPQWHFDILRGLNYFRASGAVGRTPLGRPEVDREEADGGGFVAAGECLCGQDVLRDGDQGAREPLEYFTGFAGAEVGGDLSHWKTTPPAVLLPGRPSSHGARAGNWPAQRRQ